MEKRIIDLETRIAFYEKTLDELSALIFGQSKEIGFLRQEIERINETVKAAGNNILKDIKDESPPPHY
jgi:SlyX protein